jgi:hypothetical protein
VKTKIIFIILLAIVPIVSFSQKDKTKGAKFDYVLLVYKKHIDSLKIDTRTVLVDNQSINIKYIVNKNLNIKDKSSLVDTFILRIPIGQHKIKFKSLKKNINIKTALFIFMGDYQVDIWIPRHRASIISTVKPPLN